MRKIWNEKQERIRSKTTVSELLSKVTLEKREEYMKSITEVICFLIENESAFREDCDSEEHREMGVFRNLFEFKLKDSEELRNCQQIMSRNTPDIENELISIIAKLVEEQITNDINSAILYNSC